MVAVMAFAEHIHWLGDYDSALAKAKAEQKPLMVLLVKNECGRCGDTLRDIFADQPYIARLNEQYIAVIVTFEGNSSYPVELYYSTVFPALFIVDGTTESFRGRPFFGEEINQSNIQKIVKGL